MFRGPSRLTLIVLAAGLAPVVVKKAKPLAKNLGDLLVKAGESLREAAKGTSPEPPPSNDDVRQPEDTTKVGAKTEDVDLDTASPTGHEEVESDIAAEAVQDGAAPDSPQEKTPPDAQQPTAEEHHDRKPVEPDQPLNPKRNQNSQSE